MSHARKKRRVLILAITLFIIIAAFWLKFRMQTAGVAVTDDALFQSISETIQQQRSEQGRRPADTLAEMFSEDNLAALLGSLTTTQTSTDELDIATTTGSDR